MSEANSALSFVDLVTRIARESGIAYYGSLGNERAMPPLDIHDLELCKEIVNGGIKMFMADAPASGWKWRHRLLSVSITGTRITGTADSASATGLVDLTLATTYDADDDLNGYYIYITAGTGKGSYAVITDYTALTGAIVVTDWLDEYGNAGGTDPVATDTFAITAVETVGGDVTRYPLPETFAGEISGKIQYAANTNIGSDIDWSVESIIRAQQENGTSTCYPSLAAIRPWEPRPGTLGPSRRLELLLNNTPPADLVLQFPYVVEFDKLDLELGLTDSGSDTTLVDAARTEGDDYFNTWKIRIISGTGKGSWAYVTNYAGSTGTFGVADWLTAAGAAGGTNPTINSVYAVEPRTNLHPAGQRFDNVVLSAVLHQLEIRDKSVRDAQPGYVSSYLQKDLPKAYQTDARIAMNINLNKSYPTGRNLRDGINVNIDNITGRF